MPHVVLCSCGFCRVRVLYVSARMEVAIVVLVVEMAFPPFPILPRQGIFAYVFISASCLVTLSCAQETGPAYLEGNSQYVFIIHRQ